MKEIGFLMLLVEALVNETFTLLTTKYSWLQRLGLTDSDLVAGWSSARLFRSAEGLISRQGDERSTMQISNLNWGSRVMGKVRLN